MPRKKREPLTNAQKETGKRLSLHRDEYKVAINLLKKLRKESGLKQEEAAERLGVQQTFLSKIETRDRRLDIIELRDLCRLYGVELADFVRQLEETLNADKSG